MKYTKNIISFDATAREALQQLNELAQNLTLFIVDEEQKLIGTLTDGDIRRCLINGLEISDTVDKFANKNYHSLKENQFDIEDLRKFRELKLKLIPVLDADGKIKEVLDLELKRSKLPIDAVIMAGGRGSRLRPMTDLKPKPLLEIDGKPIIEYNIDRLALYGVENIYLSINYLGEQLVEYFGDGQSKALNISYIEENKPLGTIGAINNVPEFHNEYILVMNSDLLTNIDFEDFFKNFKEKEADMSVLSVAYKVEVPYAVIESEDDVVKGFKEKPTYTFYSNGGIYLFKKSVLDLIPKNEFYNATDLMEEVIKQGMKLVNYPFVGYWLDIGKPQDFKKAQEDVKHIIF